jgi:D-glycero-D-manno-heptose 1,7-bisphosphate phosphatase
LIVDINWNLENNLRHLIILDRDDTLIDDSMGKTIFDPSTLNVSLIKKLAFLPKIYYFAIATNQSAISRGLISYTELIMFHKQLVFELDKLGLPIVAVAFCPHSSKELGVDNCLCRKPRGKMLSAIGSLLKVNPNNSLFIGNNNTDLVAALESGFGYMHVGDAISSTALDDWSKRT